MKLQPTVPGKYSAFNSTGGLDGKSLPLGLSKQLGPKDPFHTLGPAERAVMEKTSWFCIMRFSNWFEQNLLILCGCKNIN